MGVVNRLRMRIVQNLVEFPPPLIALHPPLVTVNYHMALHMPEVILDYGPPHAFWCFAYERMNGILASTPTNNRGIENEVLD